MVFYDYFVHFSATRLATTSGKLWTNTKNMMTQALTF